MKKDLTLPARILISILFFVSAIAKMIDFTWAKGFSKTIWMFEKQLVDLDIATWCSAPYMARVIIAIEIAIGFAILQNHFIKKIVIPFTIFLLVAFNIHLSTEMYKHGAMNGNCGCFGQLIPMTPLEAFVKNLIAIAVLIYLYKKVSPKAPGTNKSAILIITALSSALFLFMAFPFPPCEDEIVIPATENIPVNETLQVPQLDTVIQKETGKTDPKKDSKAIALTEVKPEKIIEKGPKNTVSKFAKYSNFGGKTVNIDEGKKIVCMFAAGCDHCRETARELTKMATKPGFPEIVILFMDEEVELIPDFFKFAKAEYPYQVLKIPEFWQIIGNDSNTPGVAYLWNGNILKFYEGTEGNKFDAAGLKKAIEGK
jgi:thiol-disulfide isomerase/thioredoxin